MDPLSVCRKVSFLLAALFIVSSLGCGVGKPRTVSISGKVLYANGKPLTAGTIVFEAVAEEGGAPLTAIQRDGTFVFSSVNGVQPGEYRVSLATPEEAPSGSGEGEEESKSSAFKIPGKYLQADTSGWKATVKESGTEPFTFTIR